MSLSTGLSCPLITHTPQQVIAYRAQVAITADRFQADISSLVGKLPDRSFVVNLCADRYRFMVGFAAALLKGQTTLMPMVATPESLRELMHSYPDLYVLTDAAPPDLPHFRFPETLDACPYVPLMVPVSQQAVILFTSGSTGRPRPVPKSWGVLVQSARTAGRHMACYLASGGCIVGTVPHQHSYGLESIILLAWQHQLSIVTHTPLFPEDIRSALMAVPLPRMLVTTPAHLRTLVHTGADLPQTTLLLSATAPLPDSLARSVEKTFRAPLMEIYGCSEAGQIASRHPVTEESWRCFDEVALHHDDAGWWATGAAVEGIAPVHDHLEMIEEGRFLLGARLADMVNIAGKRNSLSYLSQVLSDIPGVEEGIFLAPEDNQSGLSRLKAVAVAPHMDKEEILHCLKGLIDPAFLPRPLLIVSALPRNSLGKVTRSALLALFDLAGTM